LRENHDAIDFAYLESWITNLSLGLEFVESWREAFPDAAPPRAESGS